MDGGQHTAPALIGPNAVIQLGEAMRELCGEEAARQLFDLAGWPTLLDQPPREMINERVPVHLFSTLWSHWPPDTAAQVSRAAGRLTADYIMANRIPGPIRFLLRMVPARLGARMLFSAIQKHAWTFAGSGACKVDFGASLIWIKSNPLPVPEGAWHAAVFERMFQQLIAQGVRVKHATWDVSRDRFAIELP